jgi:hypothetical protein
LEEHDDIEPFRYGHFIKAIRDEAMKDIRYIKDGVSLLDRDSKVYIQKQLGSKTVVQMTDSQQVWEVINKRRSNMSGPAREKTTVALYVSVGRNTQEGELLEPDEDSEHLESSQPDCQIHLLSPEIHKKNGILNR